MSFLIGFLATYWAIYGLLRYFRKPPVPEYQHGEPHSAIAVPSLESARRTIEGNVRIKALPGTTLIAIFDAPGPYGDVIGEIWVTLDP